jgi:hypothetical protein
MSGRTNVTVVEEAQCHSSEENTEQICAIILNSRRTVNLFVNDQMLIEVVYMRVYPKVYGLATWSKNCKWYSSLSLGAVVSLFCESF